MTVPASMRNRLGSSWVPDALTLLGILAYGLLSFGQASAQVSVLDEGLYLYKGLLFARGDYIPFQAYGPLTNHMPLSFLIPGWVQLVWGEGIRTGRFFALAMGVVMMILLWRTTRREASPWWSAAAVWAVAFNPALVKIYSQAISQVLVATLLMGILYLGLGRSRNLWQTTAAAALAGALWMTRINMLLVLPLLLAYLWLTHGRRAVIAATISGGAVVALGHAIYWPGILKLWAKWLPAQLTPFLDSFRITNGGTEAWSTRVSGGSARGIVVDAIRKHFLPVAGGIWAWICYPGKGATSDERQRTRDAVFLSLLLLVLAGIHTYATLGLTYCPFCLANYFGFFSPIGLVLMAIAGAHWLPKLNRPRRFVSLGFLLLFPVLASVNLGGSVVDSLLSLQVPRMSLSAVRPGTIELGNLLGSSLGVTRSDVERWVSVGMAVAVLLCLTILGVAALWRGRLLRLQPGLRPAVIGLLAIVLATSSIRFGNTYAEYDCGLDVIRAQEEAGAYLRSKIDPGARVYWGVGQSPAPLLYLDQPRIFPPQLNGTYTFRIGGDPSELGRFSHWNQALASEWLAAADFALVDVGSYEGWIVSALDSAHYDQIRRSPATNPCEADSAIMIFRRITPQE